MSKIKSHKSISSILHSPQSPLAKLTVKVNQLRILNQCFHDILEPKLAKHCQVANFENGILVIIADNSSCGTIIRYMLPEFTKKLCKKPGFQDLKSMRCIVRGK